jgi:hypothetical protein
MNFIIETSFLTNVGVASSREYKSKYCPILNIAAGSRSHKAKRGKNYDQSNTKSATNN